MDLREQLELMKKSGKKVVSIEYVLNEIKRTDNKRHQTNAMASRIDFISDSELRVI